MEFSATMNITFLADIAGRITRETLNADRVTVSGVALPSGAVKAIRKRIPKNFPKWREATDANVGFIVDLILREALGISAASIGKESPAWDEFWRDAADAYSRAASSPTGKIGFIKASTVIKYTLFGLVSSMNTASMLTNRQLPLSASIRRPGLICTSMIFDNEIHGDGNVETFMELWLARNEHQPLENILGIKQIVVDVSLMTEQEEPLLLLADYVAGLAHSVNSKANTISASKITRSEVMRSHGVLKRSCKYAEHIESFSYRYHDVFPSFKTLFSESP